MMMTRGFQLINRSRNRVDYFPLLQGANFENFLNLHKMIKK